MNFLPKRIFCCGSCIKELRECVSILMKTVAFFPSIRPGWKQTDVALLVSKVLDKGKVKRKKNPGNIFEKIGIHETIMVGPIGSRRENPANFT